MKNSSQLLALGLVLFLGACSTTEESFLDKVKGKTVYGDASFTDAGPSFSADGKTFQEHYKFVSSSDGNTAIYEFINVIGPDEFKMVTTVTTTDGKTGTMTITMNGESGGEEPMPIWLN